MSSDPHLVRRRSSAGYSATGLEDLSLDEKAAKQIVFEALAYLVFLITYSTAILLSRNNEQGYYFRLLMDDLFVQEEFPGIQIYKNFYDIASVDEFYEWAEGPLVEGIFAEYADSDEGYIYGVNKVIGLVRIRQKRVALDSCTVDYRFRDEYLDVCTSEFNGAEDTEPFGPDGMYVHYNEGDNGVMQVWGQLQSYDGSGHRVDLVGTNITEARQTVLDMKDNGFVDMQTRAILIDLVTYNGQAGLFGEMVFVLEFPATGGVIPYMRFRAVDFYRYSGEYGTAIAVMEIIVMVFVLGYSYSLYTVMRECRLEFLDVAKYMRKLHLDPRRWRYDAQDFMAVLKFHEQRGAKAENSQEMEAVEQLKTPRYKQAVTSWSPTWFHFFWVGDYNMWDSVNLCLFYIMFILRLVQIGVVSSTDFNITRYEHLNRIGYLSELYYIEVYVVAFNAFLCWCKVFKYLGISARINQLMLVFQMGAKDIMYFILIWAVVFVAFALFGNVCFGVELPYYRTLTQSCIELFRGVSEGDLHFDELYNANRGLGVLFYILYYLICFFFLLNMFLAIINEAYENVRRSTEDAESHGIMRKFWRGMAKSAHVGRMVQYFFPETIRRKKRKQRTEATDAAGGGGVLGQIDDVFVDVEDDDGGITPEKLIEMIVTRFKIHRRRAEFLVNDAVAQFDRDGDGVLDEREANRAKRQLRMMLQQELARRNIDTVLAHVENRVDALIFHQHAMLGNIMRHLNITPEEEGSLRHTADDIRDAAVKVQACMRGALIRRRVKALVAEKRQKEAEAANSSQ